MTDLCHGKTAQQSGRDSIRQIFLVMVIRAKPLNASGEKTELNPQLDDQADIMEGERFEGRYKFRKIFLSSHRTGHKYPADSRCGDPFGPSKDLLPVDGYIIPNVISELRLGDH